jgi:hypothetical protein
VISRFRRHVDEICVLLGHISDTLFDYEAIFHIAKRQITVTAVSGT